MTHRVRAALGVTLVAAVMVAGCGDGDAGTTTTTGAVTTTTSAAATTTATATTTTAAPSDGDAVVIEIRGFAFSPADVTVPVGTTVEWVNRDGADHTTTASSGEWNAGLGQNEVFRFVADAPGEFPYVCTIHMGMAGVLIVEG
jgi:plastocyanin